MTYEPPVDQCAKCGRHLDAYAVLDAVRCPKCDHTFCAPCAKAKRSLGSGLTSVDPSEMDCPICQSGVSHDRKAMEYGQQLRLRQEAERCEERRRKEEQENARREKVQLQRREQRVCTLCGRPFSFLDRLFSRTSHHACAKFTE